MIRDWSSDVCSSDLFSSNNANCKESPSGIQKFINGNQKNTRQEKDEEEFGDKSDQVEDLQIEPKTQKTNNEKEASVWRCRPSNGLQQSI